MKRFFLLMMVLWGGVWNEAFGQCPQDKDFLEELFLLANGGGWNDTTNWLTNEPLDLWFGITATPGGCITEIRLPGNGLAGQVPALLAQLKFLEVLDLRNNNLVANTDQNGNPVTLMDLWLNQDGFRYIDLSGNEAYTEDIFNLTGLASLEYINLGECSFTGSIPHINNWNSGLIHYDLSGNLLSGVIPPQIGDLKDLTYLDLSNNPALEGGIIGELGALGNLDTLDLHESYLGGTIPYQLGNLSALKYLDLSFCVLEDGIPSELGKLGQASFGTGSLTDIFLNDNLLTDCFHDSLLTWCHPQTSYKFNQDITITTGISDTSFMAFCTNQGGSCCPSISPSILNADDLCEGGDLHLQCSSCPSGPTYFWTGPSGFTAYQKDTTLNNIGPNAMGTYHLFASENGCTTEDSVIVVVNAGTQAGFTIDASASPSIAFTNTSNYSDTLEWDFGDGSPVSTTTNPTYTYADDGFYEVCLTVKGICDNNVFCETIVVGNPSPNMVFVPSTDSFEIGCTIAPCDFDNNPLNDISMDTFLLGATEVTQIQFDYFMNENPSRFTACGGNCPVDSVTWFDAILFCNFWSIQNGLTPCYYQDAVLNTVYSNGTEIWWDTEADGYRLPTEAEWEYAARGGPLSSNKLYAGSAVPGQVAWYNTTTTNKVRDKDPNELDIYDMSGNVWEWCWGTYHGANDYPSFPICNPLGNNDPTTTVRVIRGGAWDSFDPADLRVFNRSSFEQSAKKDNLGFRLAQNKD